jgi:hypothetical protein
MTLKMSVVRRAVIDALGGNDTMALKDLTEKSTNVDFLKDMVAYPAKRITKLEVNCIT